MQNSGLWFLTGLQHITDLNGYDHILFLLALCAPYEWKHRLRLLGLITAFTLGHSLSLALSTFGVVRLTSQWVEFAIALSIFLMGLQNLIYVQKNAAPDWRIQYLLTGSFGLIHGLGFSTLLRSMLGKEEHVAGPLLAFNTGLEAGQIVILTMLFLLFYILRMAFPKQQQWQVNILSLLAMAFAVKLISQRLPNLIHT